MRDIASRICREYLSGAWKTISAEDIQLRRIRLVDQLNIVLKCFLIVYSYGSYG